MVVVDFDGNTVEGRYRPSSDTATHIELYRKYEELAGVVHTHSTWAVTFAQAGMDIPAQAMEEQGCIRVSGNLDRTADMSRALVGAGVGLEEIFVRSLSLEDYYLRMTGGGRHE
jgi:L-ribulose-5-phosphate 4-epimerase